MLSMLVQNNVKISLTSGSLLKYSNVISKGAFCAFNGSNSSSKTVPISIKLFCA